ncbi:hypothetical protein YC2023_010570 [Brassica napus]
MRSIDTHPTSSIKARPISSISPHKIASSYTHQIASIDTHAVSRDTNKPTSIDITTSPSIDTSRESQHNEYEVCGNLFDGETTTRSDNSGGNKKRNWKKRKRTKGGSQLSLISRFSDGVRKSRVRNRCFSQPFAKLRALLIAEMIDKRRRSEKNDHTLWKRGVGVSPVTPVFATLCQIELQK